MKKRILSLMLCVVMLISIGYQPSLARDSEDAATPTDAAIQTDAVMLASSSAPAIMMGTEGISGYDSAKDYDYVYFGNWEGSGAIKWRVLDDKTNTGENGLFLLSDSTLGTRISFDKTSPYSNTWQGSDAQGWCSSFYTTNLTTREQGAVLDTTKSDEEFTCTNGYKFSASTNILSGDKVFFLSAEEAENGNYGYAYLSTNRDAWWLRSPVADRSDGVGIVTYTGNVTTISTEYAFAARPAFNLNTSFVLFTSAAVGGKADEAVDESLTAVGTGTGEWKLTLKDASRNSFTASTNSNGVNYEGYSDWTMDVSYEHAQTGDNEYVSAMIVDKNGTILHYGRIANNSASGTAKVTIPAGLAPGSYTLKVFSEQCNGDKQTDYASDFQNISLTVSNTYTVSFNANGGSGDMPDVTRVSGEYILPECVFTAPDDTMEFEEWLVNEVPYDPGENITVSGNVIVKAVWKKITYFITITDKSGNAVQITPSNCHDVLGDGTVSYTPPTVDNTKSYTNEEIEKAILGESVEGITPAVLTLNNANLRQIYFENFYLPSGADPAARATANLFRFPIVKLEGENTIINEYKVGIRVYVGMIITGDGSLTINANGSSAIAYGVGGLYLQKSGTVMLNAYSRGIYQGEPINIWFQGGKLTIQAGNSEDESSGAIAMFDGFSMADNAALWLGDSAETNCILITPPNDAENWRDAIIRQWRTVGSENYKAQYLQLTTTYTVTLNVEGGTIADGKNVTGYTYGAGVTLPTADDVTYDGHTFKGWYDNEDLTGSPVTAIGDTETGDKEYWAKWEVNTYNVTLNVEGGTIADGKNVTGYTYGAGVALPAADDMTYDGHTFKGWYDNEDLTGSPVTAISDTETGDEEYWAKWEVNQYTITVRPENGEADIIIRQDYGTPVTAPTLTREGYKFHGWDTTFPASMPCEDMTVTALWLDVAAPTGEITIAKNSWNSFLNKITFGIFFKDTQTVTITAADNSGETVTIEYLLSNEELTETELADMTFASYNKQFNINPDNEYVIYAKLTDTSRNAAYVNTDGIILDATVPDITGIENGKTYCAAQTVTVTDEYIGSVTVNGKTVDLNGSHQFTLNPAEETQTIVVADKAGNVSAEMVVTVNDGHTDKNTDHKCDFCGENVGVHKDEDKDHKCDYGCATAIGEHKDENKDHKCDYGCAEVLGEHKDANKDHKCDYGCVTAIGEHKNENNDHLCDICKETLSKHSGGKATCKNKAVCEICGKSYGELSGTSHSMDRIPAKDATVTEAGNIEYWHCKDCGKYFSDKNGKNIISLKDTVISKLTEKSTEEMKTTSSVDENTVSTVSTEGADATEFRTDSEAAIDGDEKSPKTGDTTAVILIAMLFSLAGACVITFGRKRRKH